MKDTEEFIKNLDSLIKKGEVSGLNTYSKYGSSLKRFVEDKDVELKPN